MRCPKHQKASLATLSKFGKVCVSFELRSWPISEWERQMEKLSEYLRVAEAASFLGVSSNTLRNWVSADKIPSVRHPINSYRLFKRSDLEAVLRQAAGSPQRSSKRTRSAK